MTSLQIQDAHQCSGTRINTFPSPIQLGRLRPALLHFSPKWCKRNPCWILGYWEWQKSNGSRTHTQQKGFATALWLKRGPFFLRHVPCNHQARDSAVLKVTQIATSLTFPGFFVFCFGGNVRIQRGLFPELDFCMAAGEILGCREEAPLCRRVVVESGMCSLHRAGGMLRSYSWEVCSASCLPGWKHTQELLNPISEWAFPK